MQNEDPYQDLEQEAPLLASLRGKQPHEVPEGYFDNLADRMMDRIQEMESEASSGRAIRPEPDIQPGRSQFLPFNMYSMGIAASLAILIGFSIFFFTRGGELETGLTVQQEFALQLDGLSADEVLDELDFNQVDEDELIGMMGDEALASLDNGDLGQNSVEYLENMDWEDLDFDGIEIDELGDMLDF